MYRSMNYNQTTYYSGEGLEQPTMSQSTLGMATLSKHHNLAIKFELLKFQITNQILPVVYHKK